ncbi:AbfB domain-containing protein [Nonomuraea sp. NPDC046802]|uniref:AbfB domain-containing protein n=1 Tax=Nonomuraea sp. NPDC046802 TaxID=3154919 RepID=UPI0033D0FDF7
MALSLPLLLAVATIVFAPPAHAAGPAPHYLMTAFTNSSESDMYVYDSVNATTFTLIRSNAYRLHPAVRPDPRQLEPVLVRGQDRAARTVRDGQALHRAARGGGDMTAVPTGNQSLRSANVPDRYVRHRSQLAYLDPLPASSPAADRQPATFTVSAGLAHSGCYSFQPVNQPGYYLRHYNYELRLDLWESGSVHASDASYTVTSPLA